MGILSKAAANAHGAIEQTADAAAPAAQWLEEERDALGATGAKLVDSTCKYVAAHPLQSLGFALMAGYMIGRLASALKR
jgi:ElaB/YqjD/DUF883 family membrane-anchored ribosome-binding protein